MSISADRQREEMHISNKNVKVMSEADKLSADELRHGWAGVAAGPYVRFLRSLVGLKTLCAKAPVYAVGYDWRQSNRDSGKFLNDQITGILTKEQADQFILITHSMGGMVARACLQDDASGNSGKLLGVIHVVQPAAGAPTFFRRTYTGAVKKWDGGRLLGYIQGTTAKSFVTVMSGLQGPLELLPNDEYTWIGYRWLWDDRNAGRLSWGPPIFDAYISSAAPAGIWWSVEGAKKPTRAESDMRARISESDAFHRWLGHFRHDFTWTIYGTGLETDVAAIFNNDKANKGIQPRRGNLGDGTVPATSGGLLFGPSATSKDSSGDAFIKDSALRQCELSGVEHGDAFKDSRVQTVVQKMLQVALRCCGEVKFPADVEIAALPADQSSPPPDYLAETQSAAANDTDSSSGAEDDSPTDTGDSSQRQVAAADAPTPEDWSIDDA
jgi:pimeloyl-ACP methyl ester carboxylesterase